MFIIHEVFFLSKWNYKQTISNGANNKYVHSKYGVKKTTFWSITLTDKPFMDCTHAGVDSLVGEVEHFGGVLAFSHTSIGWSI